MSKWLRIAKIIAREAAYRVSKKHGREYALKNLKSRYRSFFSVSRSVLRANLVMAIVYSAISMGLAESMYLMPNPSIRQMNIVIIFSILGLLEIFLGAFTMANFFQTLMSDRLLDTITYLPITNSDIRKILLALTIYWGGLSSAFLILPGAILVSYQTNNFLLLIFSTGETVFCLLTAFGIGYFAGSIAPKTTRNPIIRGLSTLIWMIIFGFGFIFFFVESYLKNISISIEMLKIIKMMYIILPPFNFVYSAYGQLNAVISSLIWLGLSYAIFRKGVNRYWKAVYMVGISYGEAISEKGRWSLWGATISPKIRKDLTLLFRTPRMLASTLYLLIFPMFIIFPFLAAPSNIIISPIIPALALFVGGLSGIGTQNLYSVDGEGAKLLYLLPISREDVIKEKALTLTLLATPFSMLILFGICWRFGLLEGIVSSVTYTLALMSSSLFSSYLDANNLPREMAAWTPQSISGLNRAVKTFLSMLIYAVLAGIAAFPVLMRMITQILGVEIGNRLWIVNVFWTGPIAVIEELILLIVFWMMIRGEGKPL